MSTDKTPQKIEGAVRIGRSGTKLHPATKTEGYGVFICCSCPGTQQGAAYRSAMFLAGAEANCRSRK